MRSYPPRRYLWVARDWLLELRLIPTARMVSGPLDSNWPAWLFMASCYLGAVQAQPLPGGWLPYADGFDRSTGIQIDGH